MNDTFNKIEDRVIVNALHKYANTIANRIMRTDDIVEYIHSLKEGAELLKSDLDFGCLDIAVDLKGGVRQRKKFENHFLLKGN